MSSTWPLVTKQSGQPSLSKSIRAHPQPTQGDALGRDPEVGVRSSNSPLPWFMIERVRLVAKLVTNRSTRPSPSTSSASAPMPAIGLPVGIVAGAGRFGDSSNVPSPRLWKTKFGHRSLAT